MNIPVKAVGYGIVIIIAGGICYKIHSLPDTATLDEVLCKIKKASKNTASILNNIEDAIHTVQGE